MKNIVMIVCPTLRHQYTANAILSKVPIAGIIKQHRVRTNKPKQSMTEAERLANDEHFRLRDEAEKHYFLAHGSELSYIDGIDILHIHNNLLDDPRILEFVKKKSTDILITLGCGLVRNDVLEFIDYGLNLHLGMSPRYRGSAGLFWPIYNMDVERIAASILVLEDNIDGGPVVHHSRPNIIETDQIHDIACKTVLQAADDFASILYALHNDKELIAKPQKSEGRTYYEGAYHPRHLRVTDYLMKSGLIKDYLDNKEERNKNVSFVKCPYV